MGGQVATCPYGIITTSKVEACSFNQAIELTIERYQSLGWAPWRVPVPIGIARNEQRKLAPRDARRRGPAAVSAPKQTIKL